MLSANKRNKYIFILSITFNILTVCFFIGKRIYYGYRGYKSSHPYIRADSLNKRQARYDAYTKNMISIFRVLPSDTSAIVFVGTSLTQWFPVQEMFKMANIQNRGVAANTTANILNRLGDIVKNKPFKVFIEGGTNDIDKLPTDSIFSNIKMIIAQIRAGSPNSKIYYQSVLPMGEGQFKEKIENLNQLINAYCARNQIVFINLYPDFLRGNGIKKELTIDGIHLTGKGYAIWAEDIKKYVLN